MKNRDTNRPPTPEDLKKLSDMAFTAEEDYEEDTTRPLQKGAIHPQKIFQYPAYIDQMALMIIDSCRITDPKQKDICIHYAHTQKASYAKQLNTFISNHFEHILDYKLSNKIKLKSQSGLTSQCYMDLDCTDENEWNLIKWGLVFALRNCFLKKSLTHHFSEGIWLPRKPKAGRKAADKKGSKYKAGRKIIDGAWIPHNPIANRKVADSVPRAGRGAADRERSKYIKEFNDLKNELKNQKPIRDPFKDEAIIQELQQYRVNLPPLQPNNNSNAPSNSHLSDAVYMQTSSDFKYGEEPQSQSHSNSSHSSGHSASIQMPSQSLAPSELSMSIPSTLTDKDDMLVMGEETEVSDQDNDMSGTNIEEKRQAVSHSNTPPTQIPVDVQYSQQQQSHSSHSSSSQGGRSMPFHMVPPPFVAPHRTIPKLPPLFPEVSQTPAPSKQQQAPSHSSHSNGQASYQAQSHVYQEQPRIYASPSPAAPSNYGLYQAQDYGYQRQSESYPNSNSPQRQYSVGPAYGTQQAAPIPTPYYAPREQQSQLHPSYSQPHYSYSHFPHNSGHAPFHPQHYGYQPQSQNQPQHSNSPQHQYSTAHYYGTQQQGSQQHGSQQHGSQQHGSQQHGSQQQGSQQHGSQQQGSQQHGSQQRGSQQHGSQQHNSQQLASMQTYQAQQQTETHFSPPHFSHPHSSQTAVPMETSEDSTEQQQPFTPVQVAHLNVAGQYYHSLAETYQNLNRLTAFHPPSFNPNVFHGSNFQGSTGQMNQPQNPYNNSGVQTTQTSMNMLPQPLRQNAGVPQQVSTQSYQRIVPMPLPTQELSPSLQTTSLPVNSHQQNRLTQQAPIIGVFHFPKPEKRARRSTLSTTSMEVDSDPQALPTQQTTFEEYAQLVNANRYESEKSPKPKPKKSFKKRPKTKIKEVLNSETTETENSVLSNKESKPEMIPSVFSDAPALNFQEPVSMEVDSGDSKDEAKEAKQQTSETSVSPVFDLENDSSSDADMSSEGSIPSPTLEAEIVEEIKKQISRLEKDRFIKFKNENELKIDLVIDLPDDLVIDLLNRQHELKKFPKNQQNLIKTFAYLMIKAYHKNLKRLIEQMRRSASAGTNFMSGYALEFDACVKLFDKGMTLIKTFSVDPKTLTKLSNMEKQLGDFTEEAKLYKDKCKNSPHNVSPKQEDKPNEPLKIIVGKKVGNTLAKKRLISYIYTSGSVTLYNELATLLKIEVPKGTKTKKLVNRILQNIHDQYSEIIQDNTKKDIQNKFTELLKIADLKSDQELIVCYATALEEKAFNGFSELLQIAKIKVETRAKIENQLAAQLAKIKQLESEIESKRLELKSEEAWSVYLQSEIKKSKGSEFQSDEKWNEYLQSISGEELSIYQEIRQDQLESQCEREKLEFESEYGWLKFESTKQKEDYITNLCIREQFLTIMMDTSGKYTQQKNKLSEILKTNAPVKSLQAWSMNRETLREMLLTYYESASLQELRHVAKRFIPTVKPPKEPMTLDEFFEQEGIDLEEDLRNYILDKIEQLPNPKKNTNGYFTLKHLCEYLDRQIEEIADQYFYNSKGILIKELSTRERTLLDTLRNRAIMYYNRMHPSLENSSENVFIMALYLDLFDVNEKQKAETLRAAVLRKLPTCSYEHVWNESMRAELARIFTDTHAETMRDAVVNKLRTCSYEQLRNVLIKPELERIFTLNAPIFELVELQKLALLYYNSKQVTRPDIIQLAEYYNIYPEEEDIGTIKQAAIAKLKEEKSVKVLGDLSKKFEQIVSQYDLRESKDAPSDIDMYDAATNDTKNDAKDAKSESSRQKPSKKRGRDETDSPSSEPKGSKKEKSKAKDKRPHSRAQSVSPQSDTPTPTPSSSESDGVLPMSDVSQVPETKTAPSPSIFMFHTSAPDAVKPKSKYIKETKRRQDRDDADMTDATSLTSQASSLQQTQQSQQSSGNVKPRATKKQRRTAKTPPLEFKHDPDTPFIPQDRNSPHGFFSKSTNLEDKMQLIKDNMEFLQSKANVDFLKLSINEHLEKEKSGLKVVNTLAPHTRRQTGFTATNSKVSLSIVLNKIGKCNDSKIIGMLTQLFGIPEHADTIRDPVNKPQYFTVTLVMSHTEFNNKYKDAINKYKDAINKFKASKMSDVISTTPISSKM